MVQRLRSYADLIAFLVARNVPHQADAPNQAVQIATQPPALPGGVFVRWETKIPFINIMQQLTGEVPEARLREVETAICHVNDVAMIPGYGYSYAGKVIYYRMSLAVYEDGVSSEALDRAITAVLNNAVQLEDPFKKIIEGGAGSSVLSYLSHAN